MTILSRRGGKSDCVWRSSPRAGSWYLAAGKQKWRHSSSLGSWKWILNDVSRKGRTVTAAKLGTAGGSGWKMNYVKSSTSGRQNRILACDCTTVILIYVTWWSSFSDFTAYQWVKLWGGEKNSALKFKHSNSCSQFDQWATDNYWLWGDYTDKYTSVLHACQLHHFPHQHNTSAYL